MGNLSGYLAISSLTKKLLNAISTRFGSEFGPTMILTYAA
jgi:hypothetical protein